MILRNLKKGKSWFRLYCDCVFYFFVGDCYFDRVAYVIGGLVDHNRLKNVTLDAANQQGKDIKEHNKRYY